MYFTNKLINICNFCFFYIFSAIKFPSTMKHIESNKSLKKRKNDVKQKLSVHAKEELIVDVKEEETGNTEKEATDEKLQVFRSLS